MIDTQYSYFPDLLDTLGIAVCIYDREDRALLWNRTFLTFFPEHDGHIAVGEPYAKNLRRFYDSRLAGEERLHIDRHIEEGIARHRGQTRPFVFSHNGRRLRVASLPTPDGRRARIWMELATGAGDMATSPVSHALPIDMLDHLADGALVLGADDRIVAVNAEFRSLYDVPATQSVTGASFNDIVRDAWRSRAGDDRPSRDVAILNNMRYTGAPFEIELPGDRWRRVIARRTADGLGYFTHSDITALKRQQRELQAAESKAREEERRYRLLAENSRDVILSVSAAKRIVFASPAALPILGWAPEDLVGRDLAAIVHAGDHAAFGLGGSAPQEEDFRRCAIFSCRIVHRSGAWIWMEASLGVLQGADAQGDAVALVCNLRDATERVAAEAALKLAHDELAAMAATDGLTGLANRRRFDGVLAQEWRRARREGTPLCLMLIDIDHFKAVNDRWGHVVGDQCLRQVAQIIQQSVRRPGDLAARYGGEEFAVILPNTAREGAVAIGDRIGAALRDAPWHAIHPELAAITASIGLCHVASAQPVSVEALLRAADEALYRAKNAGRNRLVAVDLP